MSKMLKKVLRVVKLICQPLPPIQSLLNLNFSASTKGVSNSADRVIKIGDSINKVYQKLGYPIDLKVVSRRRGHSWVKVDVSNLEVAFNNYGTIIFVRDDKYGKGWAVNRILANTSLSAEMLNSEFGEYISEINSNNAANIRKIALKIYKERKYNIEILDHPYFGNCALSY